MRAIVLISVATFALSSCSGPKPGANAPIVLASSDSFVGSWTSDTPKATLEMKADHTFALKVSKQLSGTWTSSDLIADLVASGPNSPPMNAVLSNDKKTLTLMGDPSHPFDPSAVTIDFTK